MNETYLPAIEHAPPQGCGNLSASRHAPVAQVLDAKRLLVLLTCILTMPALEAGRWTGGGGSLLWSDPDNWSPIGRPGPSDVVYVDNEIILDISTAVAALVLDPSASTPNAIGGISPTGGSQLQLNAGILNNNGGVFRLNASGIHLIPDGEGNCFINGTGQIFMQDSTANYVRAGSGVITHAAGHTIVGSGTLLGNISGMINEGVILADATVVVDEDTGELVMVNPLVIDPGGTNNTFVNRGTLEARGAAGLTLNAGVFANAGFSIDALPGSKLVIAGGATIQGGTLRTPLAMPAARSVTGSGAAVAGAGETGMILPLDNSVLEAVTLEAVVSHDNYRWPIIRGGLINNGLWSMNGTGSSTHLRYDGDQEIGGTGRIEMSDSSVNQIIPKNSGEIVTNGPEHAIEGSGTLLNNDGGMVNRGAIQATGQNQPLKIDPDGQGFVNQGTLQAVGPAGLRFDAGTFRNTGFVIEVLDGSKLILQGGAVVQGGVLRTVGSGFVQPLDNSVLEAVTLEGVVSHDNYRWPIIQGGLVNNGVWNMNGTSSTTHIRYDGDQEVIGNGRIEMSDSSVNQIIPKSSGEVLTHGPDHTIQGSGNLLNNNGGMVNRGTIKATGQNQPLVIDPDVQGFVNQGTLQAVGPAGLRFNGGAFENAGFAIEVLDGSKLTLQGGAVVRGGTVQTVGSGFIDPLDNSVLEGVTLEGRVDQANYRWPIILGGLVNNAVWNMNGTSSTTHIRYDGSQVIDGSGRIEMSDSSVNQIIPRNSGGVLTHGAEHTIQGSGNLLANTGGLLNQGTIRATGQNQPLVIDPDAQGFVNQGTLQAVGPAGLRFNAGNFANTGFAIEVLDGSKLNLQGDSVVQGGVLQTAGSGFVEPMDNAVLEGVTLEARVEQANFRWPIILGGLVNNGVWRMNGTSSTTSIRYDGDQEIGGNGRIEMSDSSVNQIIARNSGDVLTHAAEHTIQGSGNLLGNNGSMVNEGTIRALGATQPLRIDPDGNGFQNQGYLEAAGVQGIDLLTGPFENAGTVRVLEASRLHRTGDYLQTAGSTQVDGLLTATGAVLLQGGTLVGNGTVGDVINTGGQVAPGASAGRLQVDGNFSQSGDGTLAIEVGGLLPGTEHDQLSVNGAASLGGDLSVSLINGHTPALWQQFTVLTAAGGVTGAFAQGDTVLAGGHSFRIGYTDNEVILTYTGGSGRTFESWQLTHFPNDLDNPEISGFDANPDGDVFPNGFEFAGDSDPNDPDDVPVMSAGIDGDRFVLGFVRDQDALGVTISAEASLTVEPWAADPALLQSPMEVQDNGDGTETLRFISEEATQPQPTLFLRLLATETP